MLRNVGRILQINNYRVMTAATGEASFNLAREHKPDVVVMDIAMPGLTGVEAVKVLKKHQRTSDIPVIMMTAYATEDYVMFSKQAGADDYIAKPFRASTLVRRIERILDTPSSTAGEKS